MPKLGFRGFWPWKSWKPAQEAPIDPVFGPHCGSISSGKFNKSNIGDFEKLRAETSFVYGTTNVGHGTTNADAGVGIGLKGGFNNLIKQAMN